MTCVECGKTVRANAKRCPICAVMDGMKFIKRIPKSGFCLDCGTILRLGAIRCQPCSAKHYSKHRRPPVAHATRICVNDLCKVEFVPKIITQTYCTEACKNRAHARRYRTEMTEEQRARKNANGREYRAKLKAAQEAERARLLQERIDRINAKALRGAAA